MKARKIFFIKFALAITVLTGCGSSEKMIVKESVADGNINTVSFLAGVNTGGVVENNTMEGVKGISGVDAITGATRTRFSAGAHKEIRFKGFSFETGLDYLAFDQTVTYDLPSYALNGRRDIRFQQLRVPLTCNLHLFKQSDGKARLVLKTGFSLGYTLSKSITDAGTLPEYTFKNWDYGATLGMACYPFAPLKNYRFGFYMDLFRGSKIYDDRFHTAEGMGGQSYMKFGIIVQPGF